MSELEGKTIVITGAGSGIGLACAEGFLKDGAKVLGIDIREDRLEALSAKGGMTMQADSSKDADMRAMIDRAIDETGRIDVLFNNAGAGSRTKIGEFADGEFEQMMAVHVFGAMYAMRAAIPHMKKQKYGRIISTTSRGAESTWGPAYACAKSALWALCRCMATEGQEDNIISNALIPGPTNTAIFGRDMPQLQSPEAVYPTVKMMATFPDDGPTGKVFFWEKEYPMFLSTIPEGASLDYFNERGREMTASIAPRKR